MFDNIKKKYNESVLSREFYSLYNKKSIDTLSFCQVVQKIHESKMIFPDEHIDGLLKKYIYMDALTINNNHYFNNKPLLTYRNLNHLSTIADLMKKYPFSFASRTLNDIVYTFIRLFSIQQTIHYISSMDDDLLKKEIDMINLIVVLCINHYKKENPFDHQCTNILIRIHQHKPLLYSNPEVSNETFKRMFETGLLLNVPINEILTNIKTNNINGMNIASLELI